MSNPIFPIIMSDGHDPRISTRTAIRIDGEATPWTRRQLLDRVEAEGMTMAACHFPEPAFGRAVRLEGRRSWQAR